MDVVGVNQPQLARIVGVTQGAIAKIAKNDPNGSSFLHKLARALRTTPEYLTMETDDPAPDVLPERQLSADQLEVIDLWERMTVADRKAILHMARTIAGPAPTARTLHSPKQPFDGVPEKSA